MIFSLQAGKIVAPSITINSVRNAKNTIHFWEAIAKNKKVEQQRSIVSYKNITWSSVCEVCVDTESRNTKQLSK